VTELNKNGNVGLVSRVDAASVSGLEFLRRLLDGTYPRPPFSKETDIWPVSIEAGRAVFEAMPSARSFREGDTRSTAWPAPDAVCPCPKMSP